MIAEMLAGRTAAHILVGVGPGSFTGIRVGIAAAHGMAIGWDAELSGISSLGLLAAGAGGQGDVAAAVIGGHGEVFVQEFDVTLEPRGDLLNRPADEAARATGAKLVVGSAASQLVEARGWGEARNTWPSAANALILPKGLRGWPAKPVYARAPDARPRVAA